MPLSEQVDSRSIVSNGEGSSYKSVFAATGYTSAGAVVAAVKAAVPRSYIVDGYELSAPRNIVVKPMTVKGSTDGYYKASCTWTYQEPDNDNQEEDDQQQNDDTDEQGRVNFTIGTGTKLITDVSDPARQTIYKIQKGDGSDQKPGQGGYATTEINMNGAGEITGAEIASPSCTFTIKKTFAGSYVTPEKWKSWLESTGKVNSTQFVRLPAHCVMLTGISGQQEGNGSWPMTFSFEYKKPYDLEIKDNDLLDITGINIQDIPGYDLAWVQTKEKQVNKVKVRVPLAAYVAEVYDDFDFEDLELDMP